MSLCLQTIERQSHPILSRKMVPVFPCARTPTVLYRFFFNFVGAFVMERKCACTIISTNYFFVLVIKRVLLADKIRDLFHVYLNKCEFHFSRLHVNRINNCCFLLNNGRVPCMTK